MAVVRRLFAIKAVPASALDHITRENVVATDLNGDRRIDFIGSFTVRDSRNGHSLFVVIMRDSGGTLRADVIRYDRSLTAKDDLAAIFFGAEICRTTEQEEDDQAKRLDNGRDKDSSRFEPHVVLPPLDP